MKITCLSLFLLLFLPAFAQDYFQQEVHYTIQATLDDQEHTLSGDLAIEYHNHSPHVLDSIYFHFWANAFSRNGTAFGEQQLRTGSTKFYFSEKKDRGYYSGLDFTVDDAGAELVFDKKDPDIAVLRLPASLPPGEKVVIRTPFLLNIPASFSRLGHVGTSYQMTQWYPKPAVFDHKGWHPMPYLDMGEFYSEFGSFDVTITLPANYVVGATGVLQTESEKEFLKKKVAETEERVRTGFPETDEFPISDERMKTIRFTADDVHDFAWFADKRFHVLKGEAVLASGKKVDTWAMFTNSEADLWEKGADYVTRAVEFYSGLVGEYPWPQATAVHSALSAGGGMEYPMITVIGDSGNGRALDDVITHEVGHNWFYGILASNERIHPWMDEGMNTYYEYRYMRKYYGNRVDMDVPGFITNHSDMDLYEIGFLLNARRNLDQAPDLHSNRFTELNYGLSAYVKPGTALGHLEAYLGTEVFDRMMQAYYEKWKFRHPYPEDFRKIAEAETGKDLDWFFDGYLYSAKKMDYALTGISGSRRYRIEVKNEGDIAAPFSVSGLKEGKAVTTQWYEGFAGEKTLSFPAGDYDELVLDYDHVTLEVWRKNNNIKTNGPLKTVEPFRAGFLGMVENSRRTTLNWFPALGWNKYDGLMMGIGLHNGLLPPRNFEFQSATLFGFDSKDFVGLAGAKYHIYPASDKVRSVTLGITSKAFNYRNPDSLRTQTGFASTHLQYRRLVPFIRIELTPSPVSSFYQVIQLRSVLGNEERVDFDQVPNEGFFYAGNSWHGRIINELSWEIGNKQVLNPYMLRLTLEQSTFEDFFDPSINRGYIRANLEWKSAFTYDLGRKFYFRAFAGGFLKNDYSDRGIISNGAYNLTAQGFNDYRWDDLYLGRTETEGLLSRQVSEREGGMKVALGSPYSEGRSNRFIFALNLKMDLPDDLPGKIPLKPYFDLGYYDDNRPISVGLGFNDQLWWQGGFSLEFGGGFFAIHLPVVNSGNVNELYDQSGRDGFFERIAFTLDLQKLYPWGIVKDISF